MWKEEYSNEKIICPYCQAEREIDCEGEDYDGDGFEDECDECKNTFLVQPSCSWSWTTSQDCELNGKRHRWVIEHPENHCLGHLLKSDANRIYAMCEKCGETRFVDKKEIKL